MKSTLLLLVLVAGLGLALSQGEKAKEETSAGEGAEEESPPEEESQPEKDDELDDNTDDDDEDHDHDEVEDHEDHDEEDHDDEEEDEEEENVALKFNVDVQRTGSSRSHKKNWSAHKRQIKAYYMKEMKKLMCEIHKMKKTIHKVYKEKWGCPAGLKMYTQSCYLLTDVPTDWYEANKYCRAFGANLASIDCEKENFYLKFMLETKCNKSHPMRQYWTAARQTPLSGWYWDLKTCNKTKPMKYAYWDTGYPLGESVCGGVHTEMNRQNYTWFSQACTNNKDIGFICEKKVDDLHHHFAKYHKHGHHGHHGHHHGHHRHHHGEKWNKGEYQEGEKPAKKIWRQRYE